MSLKYVSQRHDRREWTDLETCVRDLLIPYQEPNQGAMEYMQEEIDHMRACLARFMVQKGLNMNDLDKIFYTDIRMVEDDES